MPMVQFVGQTARDDDNEQANSGRLINCYREIIDQGGKAQHSLKSVLGMSDFTTIGGETPVLFIRDMASIGGTFYVMAGDSLYSVAQDGTQALLGATVSADGAMIFGDGSNVCTVTDGRYFLWNGTTMSEPTLGAFTSIGSGAFLTQRVYLFEEGGRRFQWSDLADPSTFPGANVATAEGTDDNIVRGMAFAGRIWLMKEESHEIWYVTGQSGANAVAKLPGAVGTFGLKGKNLITVSGSTMFFVGSNNRVYRTDGGVPVPIPSPAVETAISETAPTDCFAYTDEGHEFLVIRFAGRPAYCYDMAAGEWHERASGQNNTAWAAQTSAKAWGNWYVGEVSGKISKLERVNTDSDFALRRAAISNTLYEGGLPFSVAEVEISGRVGRAAVEPDIVASFSRDSGQTWGRDYTRSLGKQGEYDRRVRFHALGQFRQMTMRLEWSTADEISINNAARVEIA